MSAMPIYVWGALMFISLTIGAGAFVSGWFHLWRMMLHRNGYWAGYWLPWGFLLDRSLDNDGIRHRALALKSFAIAIPLIAFGTLLHTHCPGCTGWGLSVFFDAPIADADAGS